VVGAIPEATKRVFGCRQAFSVEKISVSILVLLVLSLSFISGGVFRKVEASSRSSTAIEVRFLGTALNYFSAPMPGSPWGWNVSVDEVIKGPIQQGLVVGVSLAAVSPPLGYMDPKIQPGSRVAVYGSYNGGDQVSLVGSDEYYIACALDLPVPYEMQGSTGWCWAASTAMILRYYGKNVHVWDVGKSMFVCAYLGQIKEYIDSAYPGEFNTSIGTYSSVSDQIREDIEGKLSKGYPVLLRVFSWAMGGHMVVVTGYNSSGFFINDPSGALFETGLGRPRALVYIHEFASWEELKPLIEKGPFSDVFLIIEALPQPTGATLHIDNIDGAGVWTTHGGNDNSGVHFSYSDWYWAWGKYWQPRGSHTNEWDPQDTFYYYCRIFNHKNQATRIDSRFEIKEKDDGVCYERNFMDLAVSSFGWNYMTEPGLPLKNANLTQGKEYVAVFEISEHGSAEVVDSIILPPIYYGVKSAIFKAECPVKIMVTDPDGLRVGYDSISNQTLNEISEAVYFYTNGSIPEIVSIVNQKSGNYSVTIFGTETGKYNLTFTMLNETGFLTTQSFTNMSIGKDEKQTYVVPEFHSFIGAFLFMIATFVAVIVHKRTPRRGTRAFVCIRNPQILTSRANPSKSRL
jgi:hypothetical protein